MDEFNESENTVSHHTRLSEITIHLLIPIIAFELLNYEICIYFITPYARCQALFSSHINIFVNCFRSRLSPLLAKEELS